MPDTYLDENGKLVVDFGSSTAGHDTLAKRSRKTVFSRVDLGTGFPIDQIWITADGRRLPIPTMEDEHIISVIRHLRGISEWLKKKAAVKEVLAAVIFSTNMRNAAFKDDDVFDEWYNDQTEEAQRIWDMNTNDFLREYIPQFKHLYQEAYKRKLRI